MSKEKTILTNWTAGELSPFMFGRTDTTKYANGAAQLTNFICKQQGPLWRRSGTRYIAEVKTSAKKTILRDFQYSDLQAYMLEFGEYYIRIYYDGGFVETAPGSGVPLELTTSYAQNDLAALKFTQSADVLYVVHPNYPPQQVKRLGANSWSISAVVTEDGPYSAIPGTGLCGLNLINSYNSFTTSSPLFSITANQKSITAIGTFGTNVKITVVGHGYATNNIVFISQATGTLEANGTWVITKIDNDNFSLNNSLSSNNVYGGGGKVSSTLDSVYVEYRDIAMIWQVAWIRQASSTTVGYGSTIAHPFQYPSNINLSVSGTNLTSDHSGLFTVGQVGQIIRITNGKWYLMTGFVDDANMTVSAMTVLPFAFPGYSVTPGTALISYNVVNTTDPDFIYPLANYGRQYRFNMNGNIVYGAMYAYGGAGWLGIYMNDYLAVDPLNFSTPIASGLTRDWRKGAFSTGTGYPRTVCFHQQRLIFGGTNLEPDVLWLSQSADFTNFAPTLLNATVTDDCAITVTLVSDKANPIIWLETGPVLLVGTQGSEWKINAATAIDGPLTPTSIIIKPQTTHGSLSNCRVFRVGYSTIFVQRAGRKLIELTYNFQLDSYVGKNLTVISEHILRKGGQAVTATYQQEPDNVVWVCLADGTFAGMTYEIDQQVVAWHSHKLGGNGIVESICSIPSTAGTETLLYFIVKRTINGVTKRYIEQMMPDFFPATVQDKANMWFLDCASQYSGAPAITISGLGYLEAQTVDIVADGSYVAGLTVTGGSITLPKAASLVTIGLGYSSIMEVMPIDMSTQGGTAQGKVKRPDRTAIRLFASLGVQYGSDLTKMDELSFTDSTSIMDQSPDFYTGDKIVSMPISYGLTGQFFLQQTKPYPLTILAIMPDVSITA